jgi:3-dehydroquinate dehydratase II
LLIPQLIKVEVHMSNIYMREEFRRKSVLSGACDGIIAGFGKESYRLALDYIIHNQRPKVGFTK